MSNVTKSSTSTNTKPATVKPTDENVKTTALATELKQLGYTATEIQERIDQYGSILDDKHVIETMMELTKNHKHKVTNAASLIYYLENNPLFIASLFHLFGNTIVTGAHTSGNIAGKDVTLNHATGSDNKTQKILWELFYIQASLQGQNLANLGNGKTTADGGVKNNKVVIGSGVDGDITINGQGQYEYNGHRFDKLSEIDGDIVFKESISDNPLINFEAVFAKLKANSDAWQADITNHGSYLDRDGKEKTVNYISNDDFSDNNQRVLDVSKFKTNAQNQMIINLGADVLSQSTQLIFKNYQQLVEDGVSLIINVDTSQSEQYDVQSQIILGGIPGGDANNDNKAFSNNNILWNFLSQTNNPLTVNFSSGRMLGSILAVNQVTKIIGGVNIDGNIVANHIELNGESHRWDLQTPNTETDYETPGETEPEEPTPDPDPEPETPDPEEPAPNPEPETPGEPEPETPETIDPEIEEEPISPDTDDTTDDLDDEVIDETDELETTDNDQTDLDDDVEKEKLPTPILQKDDDSTPKTLITTKKPTSGTQKKDAKDDVGSSKENSQDRKADLKKAGLDTELPQTGWRQVGVWTAIGLGLLAIVVGITGRIFKNRTHK